jgi:hypothetical protein
MPATATMDPAHAPPGHSAPIRHETEATTYEAIHTDPSHTQRDDASVRTASVGNAKGGIEVQRAEAAFAELSKELSRTSNASRRLSRVPSRKNHTATDVEKDAATGSDHSSDEPFDLASTLRGSRDEEEAAGIKSKRIGVVWDGLTVSGIGPLLPSPPLMPSWPLTTCYRWSEELCQSKLTNPVPSPHLPPSEIN